ncbi:hypothetical protein EN873_34985 [bacterium M00.F.Ca.ET.230.01.1.1]|nr:hypothetical protein EN873_34985 [bacterium M00.F.Ca.ET.230.01.1.1]
MDTPAFVIHGLDPCSRSLRSAVLQPCLQRQLRRGGAGYRRGFRQSFARSFAARWRLAHEAKKAGRDCVRVSGTAWRRHAPAVVNGKG